MRRKSNIVIAQRPGRLFLRVTVRVLDGEVDSSWRWTWLGRLFCRWLPVPAVTVTRSRALVVSDTIERRR